MIESRLSAGVPSGGSLKLILIVSSDPLSRTGLASLLDSLPFIDLMTPVDPSAALSTAMEGTRPDAIVWDLGWESDTEVDSVRELVETGLALVTLATDGVQAAAARRAGAEAVLPRSVSAEALYAAVLSAAAGLGVRDPFFEPEDAPLRTEPLEGGETLTPRESEVLQLLAEGLPNKTIALRLGIRETTVKFHVNSILAKLGAQSRTEAATRAARLGLILF